MSTRTGRPRLEGWKEIADYLGRAVRTVQRWEQEQQLPIRRLHHNDLSSVFADPGELDRWREARASATQRRDHGTAAPERLDAPMLVEMSRIHVAQRSRDSFRRSIELAHAALRRDPQFVPAYAALASAHALYASYGYRPPAEDVRLAREYALRAVALAPGNAEPHRALGFILFAFRWDFRGAREHFETALRIDPRNAAALQMYAMWCLCQRDEEEAYRRACEAEQAAPDSLIIAAHAAWIAHLMGRVDEAIARANAVIRRDQHFWRGYFNLALPLIAAGRYDEAARAAEIACALNELPNLTAILAHAVARAGDGARARTLIAGLRPVYVSPFWQAFALMGLGSTEEALAALQNGARARDWFMVLVNHEPAFAPLREHPAFARVTRAIGLP